MEIEYILTPTVIVGGDSEELAKKVLEIRKKTNQYFAPAHFVSSTTAIVEIVQPYELNSQNGEGKENGKP